MKKGLGMLGVVAAAFIKGKADEPVKEKPKETIRELVKKKQDELTEQSKSGWEWCCPVRPANGIEIYSPDMNGNVPTKYLSSYNGKVYKLFSSKPIFIYNYTSGTTDNGWWAIETTA